MYKKILSWLLTFAMVFSMLGGVGQVAFGQSFNDISAHWAKDDIEEWSGKGLISGYEDGTFRPDDKITRAEFVKLINNVISIKMEESISFVDVEERDWYFRDLRKAIYGEYIAGYEDNTFRANELITRQEAAVILKNLVQLEEIEGDVLGKFVDTNNTPDWSKAALILAVQKGYLTGYTDGTLKASNYITRAESVKVLDNLFGIIYNEPGVYGPSLDQGKLELKGNLTVSVNDVTLQNMIIDGDLYLAEGIGDGDVILDNITVKGETIVKGGGANSIIIRNSSLQNLLIIKKDGNIRIIAQGSTSINNTYLHSSAKLKGEELNNSFGAVEIIRVTPGVAIELEGGFEKIDLLANADIEINGKSELQELYIHKDLENVYIQVSRDSTVKKLYANSEIEVVIRGVIIEALGEFAKASSYDIKLPENLKPKSSSGTSRPAAPKYTLALDIVPAGAGTVIGSGSYEEGTEVNVSANANDGYEFVEWREGKNLLTTSSAFSYTTTSESKTFTAYFESTGNPKYSLALEVDPEGSGTVVGAGSYEEGTEVTVTATANEGYEFVEWKDGDIQITTSASFEYMMASENKTLTAHFQSIGPFAGGSGTEDNPYEVATAEQLNEVRNYLDSHFIQIADIDLTDYVKSTGIFYNDGEGWEPIGDYIGEASFKGVYDGDNFTLEGLYINRPAKYSVGLFGEMTDGALVKNLKIVNVDITGLSYVGAVSGGWGGVGYENSSVINVHVSGEVKGTENIGGLVGTNSTIRQSSSTANVHGSYAGGLVGLNRSGHAIEQSYATGQISGAYTGGLVGHNNYGTIQDSYSLAQVKGSGLQNGGVIGVGYHFNSVLTNVFAAGVVDSGGGLIGVNHNGGTDYEITSYWDKIVTGKTTSANSNYSFGKTTAEMQDQSTYVDWDFDSIWGINPDENGGYPFLRWQGFEHVEPPEPSNSFTVLEGGTYNGVVAEGTADYFLQSGPALGSLTFYADGSFNYTAHRQPSLGFVSNDTFIYQSSEGDNYTVEFSITPINDAPVAESKLFSVTKGQTYSGQVSASDADGDALGFELVTGSSYGTLIFNTSGSFTYIHNMDYPAENDSFIFKVNDGSADSNNATVTISIEEPID